MRGSVSVTRPPGAAMNPERKRPEETLLEDVGRSRGPTSEGKVSSGQVAMP